MINPTTFFSIIYINSIPICLLVKTPSTSSKLLYSYEKMDENRSFIDHLPMLLVYYEASSQLDSQVDPVAPTMPAAARPTLPVPSVSREEPPAERRRSLRWATFARQGTFLGEMNGNDGYPQVTGKLLNNYGKLWRKTIGLYR
jgi:hypothetical protein